MALFKGSDDEGAGVIDDFLDDLSNGEERQSFNTSPPPQNDLLSSPEPISNGPPPATNSIFAQPGMKGKKIKIVSAQSKANGKTTTTTTLTAPASSFTPVNRRGEEIALSDSDSEDEVPVSAPVIKKALGRPSMVPMRGGGAPKRSRGRPKKTM